jgi:hypothetical protein
MYFMCRTVEHLTGRLKAANEGSGKSGQGDTLGRLDAGIGLCSPHSLPRLLAPSDTHAAACSLDFSRSPQLYDTLALRDDEGYEPLMQMWPYFRARESWQAILANKPTLVVSCWKGIGKSTSLLCVSFIG